MPVFPLKIAPDSEGFFALSQEDLQHLLRVRRLRLGDSFEIIHPNGKKALATLHQREGAYLGKITQWLQTRVAPSLPLSLGVGMIRFSRMEWLVEKATELGLEHLYPLYLERGKYSLRRPISSHRLERLQKIAQESAKQCERVSPPQIHPPQTLEAWLKSFSSTPAQKILFQERSSQPRFHLESFQSKQSYLFLIGPEGGFSEGEISSAEQNGFSSFSLGEKILRTETAAVYAMSLLDAFLVPSPLAGEG